MWQLIAALGFEGSWSYTSFGKTNGFRYSRLDSLLAASAKSLTKHSFLASNETQGPIVAGVAPRSTPLFFQIIATAVERFR